MAVRLVIGRAGSGKTHHCVREVGRALRAAPAEAARLILLVPEQAALQMERALLGSGSIRSLGRAEVLSFRRLARRVLGEAGGPLPVTLSTTGRLMVLRSLAARHAGALREFGRVATRSGFVDALARTIVEFFQEAVGPDGLEAAIARALPDDDPSALRLRETLVLYRAYLEYLGGARVDPEGVLDLARGRMGSAAWLDGARVWVDGFAGFTAQQLRMLVELSRRAAHIELTLLLDPDRAARLGEDRPDELSLFSRTERTAMELLRALRAAGVEVAEPLVLRPPRLPRFRAEALALLESRFLAASPGQGAAGATGGAVRLVEAPDRRTEVAAVAREICRLVMRADDPLRYRDIAVIVRDLEPYHDLLSAALREHGIPFFIDRRRPTSHHPLVELVRAALRIRTEAARAGAGGRCDAARAIPFLLKTGLTPPADEACEALENYQRAHALYDPSAWCGDDWPYHPFDADANAPLTSAEMAALEAINRARRTIVERLGDWWRPDAADARLPCRQRAEALFGLLDRLGVAERLADWSREAEEHGDVDAAQEHRQVWTDLVELVDELVAALGPEPMSDDEFAEVLEAGLAGFSLGLVPPALDEVLVGSIERSRHPPIRAAFILGFSEGVFPLRQGDDALLGESERDALDRAGLALRAPRKVRMFDERLLAYIALTRPSDHLWISFPAADDEGRPLPPSSYLPLVLAALGEQAPAVERLDSAAGAEAIDQVCTPLQLASALGAELRRIAESGVDEEGVNAADRACLAVYEAARQHPALQPLLARALAGLEPPRQPELSSRAIAALFREPFVTSVSRLETFATCPFQHFAKYGLRLAERADGEISPIRLGRLYHTMLDEFVNQLAAHGKALVDLTDDEISQRVRHVAQTALGQLATTTPLEPERRAILERRSDRELTPAIAAQRRAAKSGLAPVRTEVVFGGDEPEALPALEIRTPGKRVVRIRGRIDRIDLLRAGRETLGVVFDYKRSAGMRLSMEDVYHGVALQLLTYLLVLRDHGRKLAGRTVRPVGAFYLPLIAGFESLNHPSEADAPDFDVLKVFRPRGLIDFDSLEHLDPEGTSGQSRVYAAFRGKDGSQGKRNQTDTADRAEFEAVMQHVRARLAELADGAFSGDIRVRPVRRGGELACGQCPYRGVCRFEYASGFAHNLPGLAREAALKKMTEGAGEQAS